MSFRVSMTEDQIRELLKSSNTDYGRCWYCERELSFDGTITVIHEGGAGVLENVVRECCSAVCAHRAVTWTSPGNAARDRAHRQAAGS